MLGVALEVSGIAWRTDRWAIGYSGAYEAIFADLHHLPPGGGPAVERQASSGGPRIGVRLLRVAPALMGASPFGPTIAWGFELFAAAAQEWSGAAAGSPATLGVSGMAF
jgi:hypothetical protein